jgi:hypothetical protein
MLVRRGSRAGAVVGPAVVRDDKGGSMGDEEMVWLRIPFDQVEEVVAALYGVARGLHDVAETADEPLLREATRVRISRLVATMKALRESASSGRDIAAS